MGRKLVAADVVMLKGGRCPNCGTEGVYQGPGGGVSADGICCKCGARYRHGTDGVTAIHEPDEYVEEKVEEEAGISKERSEALEQAKLDRDAVYRKFQVATHAKEKVEKELDAARKKIHDLVSASWADSVQGEAAWRERALVGEKALESNLGEMAMLRTCIHRLLDEMVPIDSTSIRGDSQKAVILEAQEILSGDKVGALETEIVRQSVGLLAGTPGSCDAWMAAVKRLMELRQE